MSQIFSQEISQKNARVSFFIFSSLLFFSVAFFVFAEDSNGKNLFEDSDQDGLSNNEEALYKTDPMSKDTDADGYMDGVEVQSGYDPLIPAPGDKIILNTTNAETTASASTKENLTDVFSNEIATIVQGGMTDGNEVSLDSINEAVQKVLSQADTEITLPNVSLDEIKIKKLSSKVKGKERTEKEKEDVVEYLTVVAYILANNSPKTFHNEEDLGSLLSSLSTESLSALALGNVSNLEKMAEKGEKILKEIKDVEVPEPMIDVHMKALKMAKYSVQLKDEIKAKNNKDDPMGQITVLSKAQGFLGVVGDFTEEVYQKLNEYGIKEIPIDL